MKDPLDYNHFDPIFKRDVKHKVIDLSRLRAEHSSSVRRPIPIAKKYPVLISIERFLRRHFLASSKWTRFNI